MAINIIKTPELYTPAGNQIIYQITDDNVNLVYYKINLYDEVTYQKISSLNIYPTPAYRNGAFINLASILQNYVKTTIKKNDTIIESLNGDIINYRIDIFKYTKNSNGDISWAPQPAIPSRYVFNGSVPRVSFDSYDYTKLVCTTSNTGKFLTHKPDKSSIKFWGTEYLYFISHSNRITSAVFNFGYKGGNVITKEFAVATGTIMGRVNVSPRAFTSNNIEVNDLEYFTVQLFNGVTPVSEIRTYVADKFQCNAQPVNLIWKNEIGGIDSYTFQNPKETLSVERTNIKVNPYHINQSGYYSNSNDNIFKSDNQIINVTDKSTYSVVSDWLTNDEYKWLATIIKSKQVYVELTDGKLLPVQLNDSSIRIENTKYSNSPLQLTINFSCESGLNISWNESQQFPDRVGMVGFNYPSGILNQVTAFEYVVGNNGEVII
ncbi:hypothetical protein [Pedobacter gandavensis]|uniref:hypothetical protein n=1 Tax=Pedobacter gandavensis TaxID=2679963 RepID=UPI00292D0BC4|nr:hypothetical protein [Pedobacter gandavensis]